MSIYAWINILALSVPIAFTFHPRLMFHKRWWAFLPAVFLAAIPFIIWDVYFTELGYWGFNDEHLIGPRILGLPIEEWAFFICIPYASVFAHITAKALIPNLHLNKRLTMVITGVLSLVFIILLFWKYDHSYTFIVSLASLLVLVVAYELNNSLLSNFYLTFPIILVPFLIVNGLLTGTGLAEPIVWYNDIENLGIRIMTIPIEDTAYAFTLLLLTMLIFEFIEGLADKNSVKYDGPSVEND